MAKKAPDPIAVFKDMMTRSQIEDFALYNGILMGKTAKKASIMIIPDKPLLIELLEDEDLKKHITMFDETDDIDNDKEKFIYAEDISSDKWMDIDSTALYNGEVLSIGVDGLSYKVPLNKGLFPMKFRKAEFTDFAYKISITNNIKLLLKKKFVTGVDDKTFTMMRIFQVI